MSGEGEFGEQPHGWEMLPPQVHELKNMPNTEIISIINRAGHFSNTSAEERARKSVAWMRENGAYKPRWRDEGSRSAGD